MTDIKLSWSISTIKIFLDNANESKATELMFDKEFLTQLLEDLKIEHKSMHIKLGEKDESVMKHFVAIQDIRDWIPNCR